MLIFLAQGRDITTLEESVFFSELSLVLGSDIMERYTCLARLEKEVHEKVKPPIFVNNDIY